MKPIAIGLIVLLGAHAFETKALCGARWYEGQWNCKIADRPMTLRFYYDCISECSIAAKSISRTGMVVDMRLRSATNTEVSFEDEGKNVFVLRRTPANSNDYANGTATIENIADPLVCAKDPLKPDKPRIFQRAKFPVTKPVSGP